MLGVAVSTAEGLLRPCHLASLTTTQCTPLRNLASLPPLPSVSPHTHQKTKPLEPVSFTSSLPWSPAPPQATLISPRNHSPPKSATFPARVFPPLIPPFTPSPEESTQTKSPPVPLLPLKTLWWPQSPKSTPSLRHNPNVTSLSSLISVARTH